MLKDSDAVTVLPAKDINRAKEYYRDKLGLEPAQVLDEENLIYTTGNTSFLLYQTDNAGTAKNTQIGWLSTDIERDVEELKSRGVVFEEYDLPGLTVVNGIAQTDQGKAAWFLDSEGNILSLIEQP